ncbi:ADP-ribosylglycohydrolase family protein, partial [Candidatus Sumerlaeota bacterium]|nr:ADP-ribosylglycohydrolase family protein [Candidatus Sumerlaeota bacterium]
MKDCVCCLVVAVVAAALVQQTANPAVGAELAQSTVNRAEEAASANAPHTVVIPADRLEDQIRGGMLGQILGNLNGLPHEMKYINTPGNVTTYTPGLPDGARTDDDTDIEWVYVTEMHKTDTLFLPPEHIAALWKTHINRSIWCANHYARQLMDLDLLPPLTGRIAINPWSDFNISGQFLCETFALMAPAMPQTAARLALHHTHVGIDGEPAQATQLFATMIATAFYDGNVERITQAGLAAADSSSRVHRVASDTIAWCKATPNNWQEVRRKVKEKYQLHNGEMRDRNGYELNTASTVAALLLGRGDFVETAKLAFNFGWDADNNAATALTIVGILRGRKWMESQGWTVKDIYKNTTRDAMPSDETISGFSDKVIALAKRVMRENGGQETTLDGKPAFRIRAQQPANVEPLPKPLDRMPALKAEL